MLRLARMDEAAFITLLAAPGVPLAIALFHAQQAVEKALKSVMCLHGIEFLRTHDLEELVAQLVDAGHVPPSHGTGLPRLTPYAVKYRYDDSAPNLFSGDEAKVVVMSILFWAEEQVSV